MGLLHVLRDLGILNQYLNIYSHTLDYKEYQTVTTRYYKSILNVFQRYTAYVWLVLVETT